MALSRSLLPHIGGSWFDRFDFPSTILGQHFGNVFNEEDLHSPVMYRGYLVRPQTRANIQASGGSEVKNEKDKFQVMLNVEQFKPEEVEVKLVDDYVLVHGKHEEKSDEHGFISREFTRKYMLPEGTESEKIKSSLSANGVLTIEAPKKVVEALPSNERVIQVTMVKKAEA